jgi:hypothetical protein
MLSARLEPLRRGENPAQRDLDPWSLFARAQTRACTPVAWFTSDAGKHRKNSLAAWLPDLLGRAAQSTPEAAPRGGKVRRRRGPSYLHPVPSRLTPKSDVVHWPGGAGRLEVRRDRRLEDSRDFPQISSHCLTSFAQALKRTQPELVHVASVWRDVIADCCWRNDES